MFRAGDAVERDLDGMWFAGEVRAVHRPPPRGYRYDIHYPDTRNVERDVPEDELRLRVSSSSSAGSKYAEGKDAADADAADGATRRTAADALVPPPQPKLGFVLLTQEGEAAAAAATAAAAAATLGASPLTATDARDRAASNDSAAASTTSHVVLHNVDDNERMQSTGTAYLTHGTLDVDPKAAGGGGLRAIRLLRK